MLEILMGLKPWMIWTVVVICLLSTIVGLALLLYAQLHHSGTDGMRKTGALIAALPLLFLLVFVQQCLGGSGLGNDVILASRRGRLLIWGIVVLLVSGTVLTVVWILGLERQ